MRSIALTVTVAMLLMLAPAAFVYAEGHTAVSDRRSAAEVAFVNVFYVPGKAITCAGGSVLATLTLLLTFGSDRDTAGELLRGACGGSWVVRPSRGQADGDRDVAPAR